MNSKLLVKLITLYKKYMSPLLGVVFGGSCRFDPSCSEYSLKALEKYGLIRGTMMSTKRIIRCHPFSKPGYDPVI